MLKIYLATLVLLFGSLPAGAEVKTDLKVPFTHGLGKSLYEKNCASCHGQWAGGSDQGPPLVHRLYLAGHHGDAAFYRAAKTGATAHHWKFGAMPPVTGITDAELARIVPYVRWVQQQNGLQ